MSSKIILLLLIIPLSLTAQEEKRDLSIGNDRYENGDFTSAQNHYKSSLDKDPSMLEANFNLGNALFRQEDYAGATKQFEQAAKLSKTEAERAQAYHNLGNSFLKSAEQQAKVGQMQELNPLLEKSIESYKNALRNNPSDDESRYNLALAQKLLKQQEQQEQNQEQQKDKNKDQEKKDDKEENKDQENEEKEDQKNKDENQEKNQENKDQNQEDQSEQPMPEPKDEISKEDAQRLLDAMKNEEEQTQDKLKKNKFQNVDVIIEKDW